MKALILICFTLIFINFSSAVKLSPPKFDQDVCFIHSYPKGEPQEVTLFTECPEGYQYESYIERCVSCRPGDIYQKDSVECRTPCPDGFSKWNRECARDQSLTDAIGFYSAYGSQWTCEQMHGKCDWRNYYGVPRPYCTTKKLDTTNYCLFDEYPVEKTDVKKTLRCPDGLEKVDGLCYPPCDAGFESVGDICSEPCPKGYLRCGKVCTSGSSCEDGKVQKIQAFVYDIEELALKASFEVDLGNMMCN